MGKPIFKNLTKMAFAPFVERGIYQTLRSARTVVHARRRDRADGFDRRFGTDTDRRLTLEDLKRSGPDVPPLWRYWPTLEAPFRRMLRAIDVGAFGDYVFIDLGSGKGRALLYASDLPFRRIIGVELSPALHAIAARNVAGYRSPSQRCHEIELLCQDAAAWVPPVENLVLYLFQPFPRATLRTVLEHLVASLECHPRRVSIAYMNPIFHDLIVETGVFERRAVGAPEAKGELGWAVYANRG